MDPDTRRRLQKVRERRTLWHMRGAALLAIALGAGPAFAGRSAFLHVGADVVGSARVLTTTSAGAVAIASRSFGSRATAIVVEQRSGAPVRLRDGSLLPREGHGALVLSTGVEQRLALVPSHGPAELVVTLFPDAAPPRVRN